MALLDNRSYYKPFNYPWAYDAYLLQQQMHWLPEEVPLTEDVRDWNTKLSQAEKNLLTQIFRFFTQADIDVAGGYCSRFLPVFSQPELRMMMASFAAMEAVHIDAYSKLIDTIGIPESEYKIFTEYSAMKDKHQFVNGFNGVGGEGLIKDLAVYSAFTEGMQLFSSFAILLNFPRQNKMKGMGQIVTWSIRDESLHVESMLKLFNTFVQENPDLWTKELRKELYEICHEMVYLEDRFIDLAFSGGGVHGVTPEEIKKYIRYIADRRLQQLNLKPEFMVDNNPLPWLEWVVNGKEHTNFFENRSTAYAKATLTGDWEEDVWKKI